MKSYLAQAALAAALTSCRVETPNTIAQDAAADTLADGPAAAEAAADGAAGCSATTSAGLMACVSRTALEQDVTLIAKPRAPGDKHHAEVRELCATRLAELGYTVERHNYATGINIVGVRAGSSPARVFVSAHYDHVENCAGADDNASGLAGTLEAARILAKGQYERTIAIGCWDEEEPGLIGSQAYAERAKANGEPIEVAYVFEMIGFASSAENSQRLPSGLSIVFPDQSAQITNNGSRGDFIAFIADENAKAAATALEQSASSIGLKNVSLSLTTPQTGSSVFRDLRRSDHASFWASGYSGIQITDTAEFRNKNYHCIGGADTVDTLDFDFMTRVVRTVIGAAATSLRMK